MGYCCKETYALKNFEEHYNGLVSNIVKGSESCCWYFQCVLLTQWCRFCDMCQYFNYGFACLPYWATSVIRIMDFTTTKLGHTNIPVLNVLYFTSEISYWARQNSRTIFWELFFTRTQDDQLVVMWTNSVHNSTHTHIYIIYLYKHTLCMNEPTHTKTSYEYNIYV